MPDDYHPMIADTISTGNWFGFTPGEDLNDDDRLTFEGKEPDKETFVPPKSLIPHPEHTHKAG